MSCIGLERGADILYLSRIINILSTWTEGEKGGFEQAKKKAKDTLSETIKEYIPKISESSVMIVSDYLIG